MTTDTPGRTEKKPKKATWTAVRQRLLTLDQPATIELIKELYDAAMLNRELLHNRCLPELDETAVFERYKKQIVNQFYPARGNAKLRLGEARKAIRDYRTATNNLAGTAELMMICIETGIAFTWEFGDINAYFYDTIGAVAGDLGDLILGDAPDLYPRFIDRLIAARTKTAPIGWSFSDAFNDVVKALEEKFGVPADQKA